MCLPNKVTNTIAKANKKGNTIPIAASGRIYRRRCIHSTAYTVPTPIAVAPMMSQGEFKSFVTKKANTMPKKTVCVMASTIIDKRRNTKNVPIRLQLMPVTVAIPHISKI